jgi:hypothetical protein
MTEDEITEAAWYELLTSAQSSLEDWIDEEGEYGEDYEKIYRKAFDLLNELKVQQL